MTDKLDPDEVACPTCHAEPGAICRTPTGRKARKIHPARRVAAANPEPTRAAGKPRKGKSPATPEGRSKGGKVAQERKRERLDLVREIVGEIRANAIVERAHELAEDAIRFDRDRMIVKRLALDATLVASATFVEAIEGYRRVILDAEGRPALVPVEGSRGGVQLVPDYRGGQWGPDDVKALAVAYGVALDKLRLEEGSATSRSEHVFEPGALASMSDRELAELAARGDEALRKLTGEGP